NHTLHDKGLRRQMLRVPESAQRFALGRVRPPALQTAQTPDLVRWRRENASENGQSHGIFRLSRGLRTTEGKLTIAAITSRRARKAGCAVTSDHPDSGAIFALSLEGMTEVAT